MDPEVSYIAGLFDGEGSFSIQVLFRRNKKTGVDSVMVNPRITITLLDTEKNNNALKRCVNKFGGKLYPDKTGLTRWSLGKKKNLLNVSNILIPYLSIKDDIGRKFVLTLEKFPSRKGVASALGEKVWSKELLEEVATAAYTLNPVRKSTMELSEVISRIEEIYE
jgi:hypothetical protein